MSNVEAKEEVLYEALKSIIISDNVDTGQTVRELHFYIADRISREQKRTADANPQMTMLVEHAGDEEAIPSGSYFVEIRSYVHFDYDYPLTTVGRIESRMLTLINKKPNILNLATSKNLRCRLCVKTSSIPTVDQIARLHIKVTRFRLICDDENID